MAAGEPIDVCNVRRDDSVLDSLGQRRRRRIADDPAARLLAALAADVDEEVVVRRLRMGRLGSLPLPGDRPAERLLSAAVPRRRRPGLRGASRSAVVAGVAAAVLSISGVAAAMTGDALAPLRAVVSTVTGVEIPEADDPSRASGAVERDLAGAEAAVSRGDIDSARAMVAEARAQLPKVAPDAQADLRARLARIEQRIEQRIEVGPASTVIVPATTPPAAVQPLPGASPSPTPTEPADSPSPQPTAGEPTQTPTPSPSASDSPEPTSTPTPDGTGSDAGSADTQSSAGAPAGSAGPRGWPLR